MASKKTSNEDLVEYMAPILGVPNRRDIIVGVNGETIRIKRGVSVKIKRKFLKVLQNAAEQEMAAYMAMEHAQEQGKKALANM